MGWLPRIAASTLVLLICDPISLGNLTVKQGSAIARQHMPHIHLTAQHGNLGKRPAGQDPWWGFRHHHLDHTTSTPGPRIHALFPCPNKSGKVRDAEFHAYMLGKDDILSGIPSSAPKSTRTEQSDSTDSRHGRPPCPPFGTSHFAGLTVFDMGIALCVPTTAMR